MLYSFRRCPYAIRARLALAVAGLQPGTNLELREVNLKAKPPELLEVAAKATVPVLVLPGGAVLEDSLPVMHWALAQHDPQGWWQGRSAHEQASILGLINENDGAFKYHLDRFKYPERFHRPGGDDPVAWREQHRGAALAILKAWNQRLEQGGWLLGHAPSLADWALLPFVRQLRLADAAGFDTASQLAAVQAWLARFLAGPELVAVQEPAWAPRSPWRSPRWLYHLALRQEWQAAHNQGVYRQSTRGLSLEEVGFIHLSKAHQVAATHQRFYADAADVLLLTIDPQRLEASGLRVQSEPAPSGLEAAGAGEHFPHLYGPLPLEAVLLAEPYRP